MGVSRVDEELFRQAVLRAAGRPADFAGIGTLAECDLHRALKYYFEPDETRHEVKLGRYVADILNGRGVVEIQTRGVYKIREKLEALLQEHTVTLVYPVAQVKWLLWADPQTGEVTKRRRSPKTGTGFDALWELSGIAPLLSHPGLSVCVCLLELEEYRALNGWSRDRKKGSTRLNRVPVSLCGQIMLCDASDFAVFAPDTLPSPFTVKDYRALTRLSARRAGDAVRLLRELQVIRRVGKAGNAFLYERA